jgi:hypothetical protein
MVSILHGYYPLRHVTVAHIFSYKRDQSIIDEIFSKIRLFSSKNGMIIRSRIGEYFDSGIFVLVPDLPELPFTERLLIWVKLWYLKQRRAQVGRSG